MHFVWRMTIHRIFFFCRFCSNINKHALYQCWVLSVTAEVIKLNSVAAVWCAFGLQARWFCSLNSAHFKTILVIIICVLYVTFCQLLSVIWMWWVSSLQASNGVVIFCYWYLYGVTWWESNFSFGLVPKAMHDIPDYVTVLDEEHAITHRITSCTEDQWIACLAFDIDCIKDCSVGGLRFVGL